ncbi:hypothetical protein DKT68_15210 [Micromonospora acroterricola]|uniref:Uncharacterized protein n=1 Tax=Micromonospora acroterricola TaxID=2202421 RepID=A0A317D740_9ACTN|nr:hypothetical protein [Micromonospora acroterricola]PWR08563.1 hypothetical protein DKT68_15210 [Micromonospora acroterricola]
MTTRATPVLTGLAAGWKKLYKSAVISGIVGDTRHAKRGGYHISIEDQVNRSDYSVTRPDDKAPPGAWPRDCAAAIDMNLSLADMKVCHARLCAVWRNRANDPRAKYINAHNGWDGNGNPGRYDWYAGSVSTATDDHEWHVHLEIRRRYVNDPKAAEAVLSILRGESLADFQGDDMALDTKTPIYEKGPSERQALADLHYAQFKGNQVSVEQQALARIESLLAQLAGKDFTDEPAIVAGVLAGLDPTAIAAAIPTTLAKQVADELTARLAE